MRIPKTFTLVNRKYRIRLLNSKQWDAYVKKFAAEDDQAKDARGMCCGDRAELVINVEAHACKESLEHTYCHELAHAITYAEGISSHDEAAIDRLGAFIHQYLSTQSGEH